ncbi:hypothetical protein [Roseivivax sp. CAU 1753]
MSIMKGLIRCRATLPAVIGVAILVIASLPEPVAALTPAEREEVLSDEDRIHERHKRAHETVMAHAARVENLHDQLGKTGRKLRSLRSGPRQAGTERQINDANNQLLELQRAQAQAFSDLAAAARSAAAVNSEYREYFGDKRAAAGRPAPPQNLRDAANRATMVQQSAFEVWGAEGPSREERDAIINRLESLGLARHDILKNSETEEAQDEIDEVFGEVLDKHRRLRDHYDAMARIAEAASGFTPPGQRPPPDPDSQYGSVSAAQAANMERMPSDEAIPVSRVYDSSVLAERQRRNIERNQQNAAEDAGNLHLALPPVEYDAPPLTGNAAAAVQRGNFEAGRPAANPTGRDGNTHLTYVQLPPEENTYGSLPVARFDQAAHQPLPPLPAAQRPPAKPPRELKPALPFNAARLPASQQRAAGRAFRVRAAPAPVQDSANASTSDASTANTGGGFLP